jgi:hypothetical protein
VIGVDCKKDERGKNVAIEVVTASKDIPTNVVDSPQAWWPIF